MVRTAVALLFSALSISFPVGHLVAAERAQTTLRHETIHPSSFSSPNRWQSAMATSNSKSAFCHWPQRKSTSYPSS